MSRRDIANLINGKYNKFTDEVVYATMEKLVNTSLKHGQDPDDYVMEKTLYASSKQ